MASDRVKWSSDPRQKLVSAVKCGSVYLFLSTCLLLLDLNRETTITRDCNLQFKVNASAISHRYPIQSDLAAKEVGVRILFVLGRIRKATIQTRLETKAASSRDILQSNQFVDTYQTSTVKTLSLFQWCAGFCSVTKYVLRIDDDVWLNLLDFLTFIRKNLESSRALGEHLRARCTGPPEPESQMIRPTEGISPRRLSRVSIGRIVCCPDKVPTLDSQWEPAPTSCLLRRRLYRGDCDACDKLIIGKYATFYQHSWFKTHSMSSRRVPRLPLRLSKGLFSILAWPLLRLCKIEST